MESLTFGSATDKGLRMSQHSEAARSALEQAVEALTAERGELDDQIAGIERMLARLQGGSEKPKRGRRPGRPKGSKNKASVSKATKKKVVKKRNWSPEA